MRHKATQCRRLKVQSCGAVADTDLVRQWGGIRVIRCGDRFDAQANDFNHGDGLLDQQAEPSPV
jgi:hypothetical protein